MHLILGLQEPDSDCSDGEQERPARPAAAIPGVAQVITADTESFSGQVQMMSTGLVALHHLRLLLTDHQAVGGRGRHSRRHRGLPGGAPSHLELLGRGQQPLLEVFYGEIDKGGSGRNVPGKSQIVF